MSQCAGIPLEVALIEPRDPEVFAEGVGRWLSSVYREKLELI